MRNDPAMTWVEAARGGNEDAAASLVHTFHPPLFAFLRRLANSESDAAELTQRTFCRAWSSLASFAGRASVSSWLHGIAYRTYVDWLRSRRRQEERSDAWWKSLSDARPRPDLAVARADEASAVYAAVDALSPELRDTLHLHYYQGLTIEETAEVLEIATSTVKYRVREALSRLQRQLADLDAQSSVSASRRL